MTQEQELQEVLKKNLPQHVGDTLKARLEQADKDEKTVKTLEGTISNLNKEISEFKDIIRKYQKLDERYEALNSREKELETKERNLEIETLKYQLQSEKDKTAFSQKVASGLVRNTEYRKTIFDSENKGGMGVMDSNGMYHYPMASSKNYNETQITE